MSTDVKIHEGVKTEIKTGRMCKVILLNDSTTPMDAVVLALLIVFEKGKDDAMSIMLSAHINGRATIDVMPKKLAKSKQSQAVKLVHSLGFTEFQITLEEA